MSEEKVSESQTVFEISILNSRHSQNIKEKQNIGQVGHEQVTQLLVLCILSVCSIHLQAAKTGTASERYANEGTKSKRQSTLAAFERFIAHNRLTMAAITSLIQEPNCHEVFERLMDRLSLHLSTAERSRGRLLSQGTAPMYFGVGKNWFFDIDPASQGKGIVGSSTLPA